jgi:uncharacterized protein YhfF
MSFCPERPPAIEAFWHDALAATPELDPNSEFTIFSFGDNRELSDHVLAETLAGRNRATASLRWAYEARLPQVGDVAIATDWAGAPRAVLVTRQVDIVRYADVDEDFARAEGYVTDPLDEWREVHWAFFSRRCAELGQVASLDMPIVCERFELVYPRRG